MEKIFLWFRVFESSANSCHSVRGGSRAQSSPPCARELVPRTDLRDKPSCGLKNNSSATVKKYPDFSKIGAKEVEC